MMTVFLFLLGIAQCLLIWFLGQAGIKLRQKGRAELDFVASIPPGGWPRCAMIIPVSGTHPEMETALRSLLEQDYPDYTPCIVTASGEDGAMSLIERLRDDYGHLVYVVAGNAANCGQKNFNLLAGVEAVGRDADILVFCDSTHVAAPSFLRCLVNPVARGEAAFSTGYHQVMPRDEHTVTLAYALSVLFMRLMQGLSFLTQPWGGAMAMSRHAFERYRVAELWASNVVDDCSLAAWLREKGVHVRLCAGALLLTAARDHALPLWRAWLERQVLFLKFCMPSQWLCLGLLCVVMTAPPLWCLFCVARGLLGIGGGTGPFLALIWFFLIAWAVNGWRQFLPAQAGSIRWLWAFFCACFMFAAVYAGTFWRRSILWQRIVYKVGRKGVVRSMEKK